MDCKIIIFGLNDKNVKFWYVVGNEYVCDIFIVGDCIFYCVNLFECVVIIIDGYWGFFGLKNDFLKFWDIFSIRCIKSVFGLIVCIFVLYNFI